MYHYILYSILRQVSFYLALSHMASSTGPTNNLTVLVYAGPFLTCTTYNVSEQCSGLGSWTPSGLLVDNSS